MTTVINNPGDGKDSNSGVGIIVGIIALIVIAGLFYVYVLPMIRNSEAPKDNDININVKLPTSETTTNQPAGY